jgi:D-lactate dehydrogenase
MATLVYSATEYDEQNLPAEWDYVPRQLNSRTAHSAHGYDAVCCCEDDDLGRETLIELKKVGVSHVLLR